MRVEDVLTLAADDVRELTSPIMLVALTGFFDIGGVATGAVDRLAPEDSAVTVGEIDPDPFYDFTQARPYIVIEDGQRSIQWPQNRIDIVGGGPRDIVSVIGAEPHTNWRTYAECITTAAQALKCDAVITVGSFADAVPHTRPPRITASTSDAALGAALGIGGPSYEGVTGVAGVLQVAFGEHNIPAISVRVGVPHYLMNTDQPDAVLALHRHIADMLQLDTPEPAEEDLQDIAAARELHDEVVSNDAQLAFYVAMLEREYDRVAEATIPSADDIGTQFESYLKQLDDDTEPDT